jgi:hypothetical protein
MGLENSSEAHLAYTQTFFTVSKDCATFLLTFTAVVCYKPHHNCFTKTFGAVLAKAQLKGKKVKVLRCPATVTGDERRTMPLDFPGRRGQ